MHHGLTKTKKVITDNKSIIADSRLYTYCKNIYNQIVVDKLYLFEANSHTDNDGVLYSFDWMDPRYIKDSEFKYDIFQNIIEIKSRASSSVILWSYKGQFPIAEIKNATYEEVISALQGVTPDQLALADSPDMVKVDALRKLLPNSHVSTYTYDPLKGMKTLTNPQGVTTYYEYDDFSRLKRTYIKENGVEKTIQSYDYHYRN